MLRRLFSLFVLFVLVACTQAPQPYRHSRTGVDTSGLRLRDGGTVQILPIEGPARPLAQIIARSLGDSLAVRNIPATPKPLNNPTHRVRGQVILNRKASGDVDKLGSIYWTFMDRQGKVIHESSQPIMGKRFQWDYGDQELIDQLVDNAADKFATYLQDSSEREAVQLAEHEKDVLFTIGDINGARGDGAQALRKAMSLTLRQFGARVRNAVHPDAYQLSAEIDILDPFENQERIKIAWIVRNSKGQELGRAQQNNRLPVGKLDGRWGRLAYDISRAAMPGIGQVVERDRLEKKFEASRTQPGRTAAPGRRNRALSAPY